MLATGGSIASKIDATLPVPSGEDLAATVPSKYARIAVSDVSNMPSDWHGCAAQQEVLAAADQLAAVSRDATARQPTAAIAAKTLTARATSPANA